MKKEAEARLEKDQEEVLVIERKVLFPDGAPSGLFQEELGRVIEVISQNFHFLPRKLVENNPSWKQIIPYLVFVHQGKIFLMERKRDHVEERLAGLFSLGIGGHIRKEEFVGEDIFAWAKREFEEEIDYQGGFKIKILGLLNEESNPVGRVHTGLVLLVEGDSPQIEIRKEHQRGELSTLDQCAQVYERMENWSKIVFEELKGGF